MKSGLILYLKSISRPRGKISFLKTLHQNAKILDVGCGNQSIKKTLSISKYFQYTGIDIADLSKDFSEYDGASFLLTTADFFSQHLRQNSLVGAFDAVISAHNLEHCNNRIETFKAMLSCLKEGGVIYIAFPSEQSMRFPSRQGTLNYFDDTTHKDEPPNYKFLIKTLEEDGFKILFKSQQYRPPIMSTLGFILEPLSKYLKKTLPGTWDYYGFESVIWAKKLSH